MNDIDGLCLKIKETMVQSGISAEVNSEITICWMKSLLSARLHTKKAGPTRSMRIWMI